ncbi:MAG: hypothetical protein JOZ69_15580 [Myxococcales bacterium]|nr:hypothetical protein [Myxococcales bacterium]
MLRPPSGRTAPLHVDWSRKPVIGATCWVPPTMASSPFVEPEPAKVPVTPGQDAKMAAVNPKGVSEPFMPLALPAPTLTAPAARAARKETVTTDCRDCRPPWRCPRPAGRRARRGA